MIEKLRMVRSLISLIHKIIILFKLLYEILANTVIFNSLKMWFLPLHSKCYNFHPIKETRDVLFFFVVYVWAKLKNQTADVRVIIVVTLHKLTYPKSAC